ncbi:MAG: branched-chain amino acid ABC transporter substrate-binding protein [Rhizobiales bacterium]|nr:branched-chain amino acid ABC transporter substrate-binding protein [Hyphomicrobiales bacterium]MBI3674617.1 branched-chain amino acid ABC transporter substrate-binding protein [Hyphomicrobiales bacterium]
MKKYLLSGVALGLAAALSVSAAWAEIKIGVAGPITGQYASFGEQLKRGAEMAVKDLNAAGGVNGEKLTLEVGDDACDPKQAVAVANQMVSKGIKFMAGHFCSGSSIPASAVYAEEGIVQITPASTNPKFTEQGLWNTNRVVGRDDAQGLVAGNFLAKTFKGKKIAILDDKSPYGKGLADETRKALNAAGVKETMNESYTAGEKDYTALVSKMKDAGIDAVYVGGYHTEGGLILRQMREQGMTAQMISGDAFNTAEFWTIAGPAGEGMIFTFAPEPRNIPAAKAVVEEFKAENYDPEGYTLYAYAAIQAWAQAATATKGTDGKAISKWLRAGNTLKTVLGDISLNEKGDIKDAKYVWYKWSNGKYAEDPSLK